jgi:DNA-binding MarR family transcriptional regulator
MARQSIDDAAIEFGQAIGLLVRRTRAAANSEELSWTENGVLRRLAVDGPATTADLARAQGMRPQSMRSILATLEELEMIERRPHETDGRQVNIVLTARGAAAAKSVGDAKRTWLAHAFAQLTPQERETLVAASQIMRRVVEGDPQ